MNYGYRSGRLLTENNDNEERCDTELRDRVQFRHSENPNFNAKLID